MSILKDLPELLEAGVISHDTAERIEHYYRGKSSSSSNRLLMLYGLLGSILIGLGLILIIAHNWDEMSRMTKNGIALAPLILGQVMCIYTLIKKEFSQTWRECVSTFLFFSIGACLSLISQIYHLPGDAHTFVFLWMILSFPIIYLMRSSMVSLLYVIGITYYGCEGYAYHHTSQPYTYWLLLIPMLPHYYQLCKKRALSNFTTFHHWVIPISISIVLGTFAARQEEWMYVAYFVLFGVFYLIGENQLFKGRKIKANGYRVIGALGTMVLLFISSSDWFWSSLMKKTFILKDVLFSPEFITLIVLTGIAKLLLFKHLKKTKIKEVQPTAFLFLPFIATFILGIFTPFAQILINLYIFIIGIQTIRLGARRNHLGLLNYGLMIIVALVVLRFVDSHIDFVIRGILFVLTGIGFFATNLWMLKKERPMNKKKIILALFIVVAAIQLYYPISMINYNEKVLTEGTTYLFKTLPVDPHDPFRGKYVDLNFNDNSCKVGDASFWVRGEKVYAVLTTDEEGFAKILYLAKEKPKSGLDCIEVKVIYTSKKINEVTVKFPFSRFYMEESKAYDAEVIHRKNQADTTKTTYAVVRIKDGTAILDDVQINGESLRELAKQQKSNP